MATQASKPGMPLSFPTLTTRLRHMPLSFIGEWETRHYSIYSAWMLGLASWSSMKSQEITGPVHRSSGGRGRSRWGVGASCLQFEAPCATKFTFSYFSPFCSLLSPLRIVRALRDFAGGGPRIGSHVERNSRFYPCTRILLI